MKGTDRDAPTCGMFIAALDGRSLVRAEVHGTVYETLDAAGRRGGAVGMAAVQGGTVRRGNR